MTRNRTEERVIRERIGKVIDARRIVRGLGVEELAKAAAVDTSQLIRVIGGKSGTSLYSLSRIAHALGWTLGELVYVAFPPGKRQGRRGPVKRRVVRVVRPARSSLNDKHPPQGS
jgi:transcriptional regulator with XRE-family HTH domain